MFLLDIVVIAIFSIVARKTDADDTWDGGKSYRECEMCSRVGWRLDALAVQILEAKSLSVCSLLCLNSAECSCVNYLPGARSCELLAAAECQSYGVSLVEDPTTVFYTRELCNNLQSDPYKCKDTMLGQAYIGNLRTTITGRTCQWWVSQDPQLHYVTDPAMLPDSTLAEAENFCRNPDGEALGPWCYTTDPDVRWEYCEIWFCPCLANYY